MNAHRSHLFEGIVKRVAAIDDNRRDPWTLGECRAHGGDSTGRGQEDETELGNVVEQLALEGDTATCGDDLDRMARLAKRMAQSDELRMPHGKDHASATNR